MKSHIFERKLTPIYGLDTEQIIFKHDKMSNDISKKVEAGKGDSLYSEILIRGTKFSIREILRQISQGKTIDEILRENPDMTKSDIEVSFEYAFELVGALDLKEAMTAINRVISKRQAIIEKLEEMKKNPPDIFK